MKKRPKITWLVPLSERVNKPKLRIVEDTTSGSYTVYLRLCGTDIGYVAVHKREVRCSSGNVVVHETHSSLATEHHGKGLGVELYSKAIEYGRDKGYQVVSSRSPSAMARRCWRSKRLNAKHKIVKLVNRFWVVGEADKTV